ncbi:endonuclease/exonuclease/phosphatase family protein [Kineococcus radiotolerans]|uniref:Endonuclease/exonuclease/phosphatase n=1 Tax=Kineococcus radiotolerans (strain ATCC BAA-149 / DSM 14245 / SRS30216) TaxID=266940 RepID=A6WD12_KINRD|nr:endonuclease/exonuclease/phosphatase family protein [Kineococcus radiotolerans]ABS04701.1 Endonuclease/exonuclease/phosphatase [Kineococcus radiotolerans SRS30216 = ATCC BAA-149]
MAPPGARAVTRLRVATVNVRELLDDTAALGALLRTAAADVVCVQEAPTHSLAVHRLGVLAADAGLWVAAAGRDGAGTAVLTAARVDVRAASVRALPTPRRRGWKPVRRRGTAEVVVRVPLAGGWSREVLVRSVHLGLDPAERSGQVARVLPGTPLPGPCGPWFDAPAVLAGDLNEEPGGPVHGRLSTVLVDAADAAGSPFPTFPARAPRRRLDLVLVDHRLSVTAVSTPAGEAAAASDHLAVVADLLVPAR